ncbi:hypothetical protein BFL28_00090 [Sphingomonas turrisvirgatae]|uniref:Tetrapyrrole biosynthesis uroporphyrinogen III synthase domain-containing protein n=1 Tax=Sphingomonas turrisvirgatae TaxID=1888892 RepID=A0A1E3LXH6_9SPHN|nr:hypothetical protein BFL28_00090 [Sphingomonas turrisvirgatae]
MVFTSIHAVRHFAWHRRLTATPILATSHAIAQAALAVGHSTVTHIAGAEAALVELIGHVIGPGARILLLCGQRSSNWLGDQLTDRGYDVVRQAVYKPVPMPDRNLAHVVGALERIGSIVLHSRTSAERVVPILRQAQWRGSLWCISQQTRHCCYGLPGVDVLAAQHPSEASLLEMIERLVPGRSRDTIGQRHNTGLLATTLQRAAAGGAQNDNGPFSWLPPDDDPYRPAS